MNKTERLLYQKHILSDDERNQCLRLINCGLSTNEIADIMHISKSTVSYIRQAHSACLAKDWSTLQRLSAGCARLTTEWAMRITGTDKEFIETFGAPKTDDDVVEPVPTNSDVTITRNDFDEMRGLLSGIYNMLSDIRDVLNALK